MNIHPSAIIDPTAELGANVEIGPFSYVGPHCKVGDNTKIGSNAVLEEYVILGRDCQVSPGAVLGGKPQDVKFKGEESYVVIGDKTIIREYVTINRASGEKEATTVGSGCMLMAYSHLGHNCKLGNEVVIANNAQFAGHVEVDDYAFVSGTCVFHQFIRIGKLAIVGGFSATRQDVPPFAMADGRPVVIIGTNKVGLKRRGFDLESRMRIKKAYQLLFFSGLSITHALETIEETFGTEDSALNELMQFVRTSPRGLCSPHRKHKPSEIRLEPELAEIL